MSMISGGIATLLCVFLSFIIGVCGAEETSVSVTEGDSLILPSNLTETLTDQQILWMFGDQEIQIAEIYRQKPPEYSVDQFRDRLMMDNKTGSLNITNIRTEDAGLYKLTIISDKTSHKTFRVSVVESFNNQSDPSNKQLLWLLVLVPVVLVVLVYGIRYIKAQNRM